MRTVGGVRVVFIVRIFVCNLMIFRSRLNPEFPQHDKRVTIPSSKYVSYEHTVWNNYILQ
jgi:hypothetical protein